MPILSYFSSGSGGEVTVSVPTPAQKGTLTYTGQPLTPQWTGYDEEKLALNGVVSATDAGSYVAVFTPKTGYCWEDLTVLPKNVVWSIFKAQGSLIADMSSISLDTSSLTPSFIGVTKTGDGTLLATLSDPSVARVSATEGGVTLTPLAAGTAYLTLSLEEGLNYTASAEVRVEISVTDSWNKYAVITTSGYYLSVPSQNCSLEELQRDIEDADEEFAAEYCDREQTSAESFVNYYKSVSIENGEIVGQTTSARLSAVYVCYVGNSNVWYYVGGAGDSGELYLFEIEAASYINVSKGELVATVTSTDGNAYPENGPHTDGYWYLKLSVGFSAVDDGNGNLTIINASVTDDGSGNLLIKGG